MPRTNEETEALAKTIVSRVVADIMIQIPLVQKAIDKTNPKDWNDALDDANETVADILFKNH